LLANKACTYAPACPSSEELIENNARELIGYLSELEHEVPDTRERNRTWPRLCANTCRMWSSRDVSALRQAHSLWLTYVFAT
jgi:hypothetical protein